MLGKPLGHAEGAQRNERYNEHRETDCSNSLRDGDCACNTEYLKADKETDFLAGNSAERVVAVEEASFGY